MIVTIVSQIGSNLLASSPLRPSGLSLWGWQRIHCQGKLSLLGLPRPLLLILSQMQVHDNLGFKFRSSHYNSAGTVKGDKLCMDASETRVVVGIHLNPKLRTN